MMDNKPQILLLLTTLSLPCALAIQSLIGNYRYDIQNRVETDNDNLKSILDQQKIGIIPFCWAHQFDEHRPGQELFEELEDEWMEQCCMQNEWILVSGFVLSDSFNVVTYPQGDAVPTNLKKSKKDIPFMVLYNNFDKLEPWKFDLSKSDQDDNLHIAMDAVNYPNDIQNVKIWIGDAQQVTTTIQAGKMNQITIPITAQQLQQSYLRIQAANTDGIKVNEDTKVVVSVDVDWKIPDDTKTVSLLKIENTT